MAMTMQVSGLDEFGKMLDQLNEKAQDVASGALFEGAGVVADAFSGAINSIVSEPFKWGTTKHKRYASHEEKAALRGKSGIAHFHKNGAEVDTLIGITGNAGYVQIGNKMKAVRLIARSINSGTSFMRKQPVFRKAVNSSKGAASEAIVAKAEAMLQEMIK